MAFSLDTLTRPGPRPRQETPPRRRSTGAALPAGPLPRPARRSPQVPQATTLAGAPPEVPSCPAPGDTGEAAPPSQRHRPAASPPDFPVAGGITPAQALAASRDRKAAIDTALAAGTALPFSCNASRI